jgi:hypothetical protein
MGDQPILILNIDPPRGASKNRSLQHFFSVFTLSLLELSHTIGRRTNERSWDSEDVQLLRLRSAGRAWTRRERHIN